jgi:hypothetical protein
MVIHRDQKVALATEIVVTRAPGRHFTWAFASEKLKWQTWGKRLERKRRNEASSVWRVTVVSKLYESQPHVTTMGGVQTLGSMITPYRTKLTARFRIAHTEEAHFTPPVKRIEGEKNHTLCTYFSVPPLDQFYPVFRSQ